MAWVEDKPCAFPGCPALVSGYDVRYCPKHDELMRKSWGVERETTVDDRRTTRKRKKHGKVEPR